MKNILKTPHAYVLMFLIVVLCTVLTWVVPAGSFERVFDEELGRELVVPGSYAATDESLPVGPWGMCLRIFSGYVQAADIIIFILFAVSYVSVLTEIGALNALTGWVLKKVGSKDILIIPVFMILFGLGGTTFGMMEETYALIPVFITIGITLGYDRIVGGSIVAVGTGVGFAAATFNPFTIGVASAVAEVDLVTPKLLAIRIFTFVLFEALAIWWVMRYARRIRKDPAKSVLYGDAGALSGTENMVSKEELMNLSFTPQQKISLLGFVLLIGIIIWGVIAKGWYLQEIAALFFAFMILTCLLNKLSGAQIAELYLAGCKSALFGALLVGLARSIEVIMTDSSIIDTVVNALANLVQSLPSQVTAVGMLVVQNVVNFFIPSGSGQAVVMMPIMAPLADLVGQSREVAVLAYQFGDGFSNLFWPTSVALECGLMGIGLNKWYKFFTPLFLIFVALECVILVTAVVIGV